MGVRLHVRHATYNQNTRAHYFKANGTKVARTECCWLAHFSSVVHGPIWFNHSLFSLHISRQICPTKVRILPDYCTQKNLYYPSQHLCQSYILANIFLCRWIGYLYLITSGLFFIALLMGWFLSGFSIRSNLDKQNKSNAALILVFVLLVNAFILLTIIMASFLWSRNLSLTDRQRGAIACTMNGSQCTNCDDPDLPPDLVCPEWSFEEITRIVRRQLNQSAFMAAIFILYDLNVMVHGFNLRKNLSMYQIDYV